MNLSGTYVIPTDRERVWAALNDPEVLKACIPGCESMEKRSETEFDADIVAKIGPVKATFKTRVTLENIEPPERYTLVGNSKAGTAGFGKGRADVSLGEAAEGGTELSYTAEFKVGGKLAQIGSRLVAGATKKTADDFFDSLSARLGDHDETPSVEEPQSAAGRLRYGLLAAAVLVVILWWTLRG